MTAAVRIQMCLLAGKRAIAYQTPANLIDDEGYGSNWNAPNLAAESFRRDASDATAKDG
jgi:hypothetical protein